MTVLAVLLLSGGLNFVLRDCMVWNGLVSFGIGFGCLFGVLVQGFMALFHVFVMYLAYIYNGDSQWFKSQHNTQTKFAIHVI